MEVTCPLSHLKSSSVRQWPWAGWLHLHPLHHPELGITQQVALSLPGTLSLTLHLFVSLVTTEMSSCRCARVWPLWTKQLDSHLIPPCFNFPTWSLCKICYRLVICFLDFFFKLLFVTQSQWLGLQASTAIPSFCCVWDQSGPTAC